MWAELENKYISSPMIEPAESVDKVTCKLCRRQFSKYTCPTCNVPYCSLTCFRSPSHSQCSETFYKKEVELDIHSGPSKTPQERLKMMEMLKKFEEENSQNTLNDADADGDEEFDDGSDLMRRFQNIDLNSSSFDDVWSKLTPAEQAQFMSALKDPTSELAQQLLASEELENEEHRPWWGSPAVEGAGLDIKPDSVMQFGAKPQVMHIPSAMIKPNLNESPLLYNVCALCIAYSYGTRHFAISSLSSLKPDSDDLQEMRKLIAQLVPFLVDRKSTTLYSNLSSLITDIWSRFKPGEMNSALFALLLRDAAHLMQPLSITSLPLHSTHLTEIDLTSHPHVNTILVLSDMSSIFQTFANRKLKANKVNHITQKLLFYAAQMSSTPSSVLRTVAEEVLDRSLTYQGIESNATVEMDTLTHVKYTESKAPVIEELS